MSEPMLDIPGVESPAEEAPEKEPLEDLIASIQAEMAENRIADPSQARPGHGTPIPLDPDDKEQFDKEIAAIYDAHEQMMQTRIERWERITDAYNLMPESERQGMKPDAQRLVSEMTRSLVNMATARLTEGILGMEPPIEVRAVDDQDADPQTAISVEEAKAVQTFMNFYVPRQTHTDVWIPLSIQRAAKLGDCALRVTWAQKDTRVPTRGADGKTRWMDEPYGGVKIDLVPLEDMRCWPLWETDIENLEICGHEAHMSPSEFRAQLAGKLSPDRISAIIAAATDGSGEHPSRDKDLQGHDVTPAVPVTKTEIHVADLYGHMVLPGETQKRRVHFYYYPLDREVLYLEENPIKCGRHTYFHLPYWLEEQFLWGSGIGFEIMYQQAADSTLLNLLIDNLKMVGNYIRILRSGSLAETMADQISPGYNLVTDDPETDVRFEALGGDLANIYQAMDMVERRKSTGSSGAPVLFGMGDPILKSGADPSSIEMLIQQAGTKFGMAQRNLLAGISAVYNFILELFDQYAPPDMPYEVLSEKKGALLQRRKFTAPKAYQLNSIRLVARAPSAAANKTMLKQHLMVTWNLAMQHMQVMMQVGGPTIGAINPGGFEMFMMKELDFLNQIVKQVVELQDAPGLGGHVPDLPFDPTNVDALIAQLVQQLRTMQAQMQAQEQAQMTQGQPQPGQAQPPQQGPPQQGPPQQGPQTQGGPPNA